MADRSLSTWRQALAVYQDRRIAAILVLGFASGLPLALTGSTLGLWLVESGVSKTAVGLFTLVALPYTLKFLWAPVIDRLPLPFLTARLGRRRSWILLTQGLVMAAILAMATTTPAHEPWWTALFALLLTFCSASQDIGIDAWRVEILERSQYGAGAATVVLGYRFGMLTSGAGALYLAEVLPWPQVYGLMAGVMVIGSVCVLLMPEPEAPPPPEEEAAFARRLGQHWPHLSRRGHAVLVSLHGAVVAPFLQFSHRRHWAVLLLFIALYKLGDVMAGLMAGPFYLELGFAKAEIASVSKVFGLVATISGGLLGGVVVRQLGIRRALLACGVLQLLSNFMYALLALTGYSLPMLTLVIGVENLTGGMATIAFVAYLSSLCAVAYTATQYALLSSFAGVGRDLLGASSGWFAERLDWVSYFSFTAATALPGLALLLWLLRYEDTRNQENSTHTETNMK